MSKTQHDTPIKRTKQDIFLEEFTIHGNVTQAARVAQVERKTVYRWKEKSDLFLIRYNQALEEAKDNIRAEIYRRGHDGVEEPVLSQGQLVYEYEPVLDEKGEQRKDEKGKPMWRRGNMITVRKYSDTLLIFHAKMLMPEYRERQQDVSVNVTTSMPGTVSIDTKALTDEELATLKHIALAQKARQGE